MGRMILINVDVTKVDKARLTPFKRRDGSEGKGLDLVLIETPDGKYGDFMVKQGCTKEERQARVQMAIIGSAKYVGGKPSGSGDVGASKPEPDTSTCPF